MPHPGEEGWIQGYSGVVAESKPVKQREWRPRHLRLSPLAVNVSDRFPLELIDRILDYLHNDSRTLRSCCLTSKAWLASSRYHLFGNTVMCLRGTNSTRFFQLFDTTSLAATYIQHVEIDMLESSDDILLHLISFVSITSLRLCRVRPDTAVITSLSMQRLQNLTELELRSSTFFSFTQLRDIFEALPLLQRICLTQVACCEESTSAFKSQRPLPHLRELDFDSFNDVPSVLRWLLSSEPIPAVSSLKLAYTSYDIGVGRFLRALGPNLECLALDEILDHAQIDLSQNYNLRTIRFNGIMINQIESAGWVMALLSQIISQRIEVIVFGMILDDPDVLASWTFKFDWEALAQILARQQFAGLRRIEFVVNRFKNKVTSIVKEKLSTYDSRGILHVTQPQLPRAPRYRG